MKYALIGLLLMMGVAFGQTEIQTRPTTTRQMTKIYSDAGGQKTLVTSGRTDFFKIANFRGAVAAFFDVDTVGCGAPSADSLAIRPVFKKIDGDSVYVPYTTTWDTVARSLVNSEAEVNFMYPLPDLSGYGWAYEVALDLAVRSGDSLNILIEIGGQ